MIGIGLDLGAVRAFRERRGPLWDNAACNECGLRREHNATCYAFGVVGVRCRFRFGVDVSVVGYVEGLERREERDSVPEYRTSGGPIAYSERGDGKDPVILLHAFPLNSKMWAPQMEALADHRRVIAPDYPGFGNSPRPPAQPDMRYYAERIRELLDGLNLSRVVLGGLSMGGYVAFACMRLFPERVRALLLANTRPDPDPEDAKETRREVARRVAEEGIEILPKLQMERLLAPDTLKNKKDVVELVRAMILESSPDGVVAALGAMRERPDSTELLEKINVPTLVIGGAEDTLSTPEIMREMAKKIPGSRHLSLPKAGHLSNLEASGEFNAALREFLEEA
jgi:3-oxoadipate enol-lactonase